MSESTRDLLVRGMAAAKAGDVKEASFFLDWLLSHPDSSASERVEAWFALSQITADPKIRRDYLENVLANNPGHAGARRAMAVLDGKLNPAEIIDPDRLVIPSGATPDPADPKRFICPQCGDRLTFAPDGQSLICESCQTHQWIQSSSETADENGRDFIVAMATREGHLRPTTQKNLACQGCGARFLLPPEQFTHTCPYCGSKYVVMQTETEALLLPDLFIPFAVGLNDARASLRGWFEENPVPDPLKVAPGRRIFLPFWSFEISGQIPWTRLRYENRQWVPDSGIELVCHHDIRVSASKRLPEDLAQAVDDFILDTAVPYDPAYLADNPAETYQVTVGDASLIARQTVRALEKREIDSNLFDRSRDFKTGAGEITVDTFRLILAPFWLSSYTCGEEDPRRYTLLINGQTGAVRGERPASGISGALRRLLDR